MSELYMMVTITNRQLTRKFVECYKEKGAQVGSVTVGMGTAANEILDYFGLDGMEKSVLFHLVTDAAGGRSRLLCVRKCRSISGNGNRIYHSREQCRRQESIELPDLRAGIRKRRGVHIERDEE